MKILLDTCTFLWLTNDDPRLSKQAKILFQNMENPVYLSSVSVWKIVLKNQLGKLPLPDATEQFINEQCDKHLIENMALDKKAIFHLTELPAYHRDPFDRMLICQAIEYDLTLLTSDELITKYPVITTW